MWNRRGDWMWNSRSIKCETEEVIRCETEEVIRCETEEVVRYETEEVLDIKQKKLRCHKAANVKQFFVQVLLNTWKKNKVKCVTAEKCMWSI